jgi:uncharacterized secreted protein with C-terminal beta-propeller domain
MSLDLSLFEPLERRQLLAVATNTVDTWTITGSDAGERITIDLRASDQRLRAIVDGQVVATRKLAGLRLIEVLGNGGNDVIKIDLRDESLAVGVWVNGGTGRDRIFGGALAENLGGGSGRDVIDGGRGDDIVRGGTDRDDLTGGDGNDYVQGNAGNDTLAGGDGDDRLTGGTGRDQLRGGSGSDKVVGGKDTDTLKGGTGADVLEAGGGVANLLFLQAGTDASVTGETDTTDVDDADEPLRRVQSQDELRDWLIERAVAQWKDSFGKPIDQIVWAYDQGVVRLASTSGGVVSAFSTDSASFTDSSTTNTQEAGVDEADLVETDGQYLYLVHNNELLVVDVREAARPKIVSTTPFAANEFVQGVYLDGDRVTVLTQTYGGYRYFGNVLWANDVRFAPQSKPTTTVTVLDVADRTAPTKVSETTFDGSVNTSRVIDGRLYLVLQDYLNAPSPQIVKNDNGADAYESEADYRERLEDGGIDDLLPHYATNGGASRDLLATPDVYVRDGTSLDSVTVALINLRDAAPDVVSSTSVVGASGTVYASADNLYLAGYGWNADEEADVLKFSLGLDQVSLAASGRITGQVLNQFSMDEEGEFFRVATTTGAFSGASNGVSVLDQVGDDLTLVGRADGIAKGESIFAARFVGDRAYLVTFLRMDPLFVLDMSDPTAPQVKGELEIPGVSTYLQPIAENLLVGVGVGESSAQASLFDVSDPTTPVRVDTFDLGGWSSLAAYDPHAFSYFPQQGVLALPSGDGQALKVLSVTSDGFDDLGTIEHEDGNTVSRSVRIAGNVFSIGTDAIRVRSLDDIDEEVATLDLPPLGPVSIE